MTAKRIVDLRKRPPLVAGMTSLSHMMLYYLLVNLWYLAPLLRQSTGKLFACVV